MKNLKDLKRREYFLLLPLFIVTLTLGILPNIILDALHVTISSIIYNVI